MPTPEQMLKGLGELANQWRWLAVVWHAYILILLVGLAAGVRPHRRTAGILASLPLLSVSVLAWIGGNPFNGVVFLLVGIALLGISIGLRRTDGVISSPWSWIPGAVMVVFGWIYPHFLDTSSFTPYLYSAPLGLIPCPTLSVVVGLGLILGGLGSRAWILVLGITGLFYGLFGALRLGVNLDWVLVIGALRLLVMPLELKRIAR